MLELSARLSRGLVKASLYISGLTVAAFALAFGMHAALAAWTAPMQDPPVSPDTTILFSGQNATIANLTVQGTTASLTQTTNARFYTDVKKGFQLRLDNDNNDVNAEFTLNNGANTEVLKIDETGLITVAGRITGLAVPTGTSDAATKSYVDTAVAAAGGGDATTANQEAIMGTSFASATDSLHQISTRISGLSSGGDATYNKQLEIQQDVQRTFGWVAPNSTYVSVGGNTAFCRSNAVSAAGIVTITPINNGLVCDANRECSGGACVTIAPLTYSGTTHTEVQCTTAGGTVFNTGTGTICKFSAASCPAGWSWASNWQRYSSIGWGATVDGCACSVGDSGPTTFANQQAVNRERGSSAGTLGTGSGGNICWVSWAFKDPSGGGGNCTSPDQLVYLYNFSTSYDPAANRIEIGCK